jgi:hypothetical protein
MSQPFGLEKGIFYWLFALMAIALCFVQLRLWQPRVVKVVTTLSIIGFITMAFIAAGSIHVLN